MNTEAVTQKIKDFIKAGDESNLILLENTLHHNYRNVQSGFFDQKGLFNFSKSEYKSLIEKGTFGGVPRKMKIVQLHVFGDMAFAQVNLESKMLKFHSLITLVMDDKKWRVIGNYPNIKQL